jgi:hypothetical protein
MQLQFDQDKYIAYIKLSGRPTEEEVLGAFEAAVADQRYKLGMGRLWDFTDADLTGFETDTIRRMAQFSKKFPKGICDVKVAFVTDKMVDYGLSRMFEAFSQDAQTQIEVFRSIAEAETWMTTPGTD